ncbi:flagellar hook-length control protein FliK [uncultured Litoreibacter sp.]|uniref:flagellar hook-length control protein FliK n=1 Tax=uncultured Litoreibacter sp. TaxID=1392394 RepID=UPI002621E0F5|nr:flagellar hook-length control protein FliK [uncultured Litoreibacter sp.]
MATEVAPPTATAQVISPTALNPATETSLPALMEVELPSAQMTNPALSKPVSPQAAAPSTASSPQVAEQVSAQISAALKSEGGQSIEIRLDPEELGRVRIVLSGKDGSMNVAIFSEKPEVLDLMRRHSDRLETDFADIGYEGAEFTFQQEDDDSQHSQQSQTGAADIDASQTEMTTSPLPSASGGEARLDLRF